MRDADDSKFCFARSQPSPELNKVEIKSARLTLRPIREADAQFVFREFTKEVARFMTPEPAHAIESTLAFIRGAVADREAGKDLQLVIERDQEPLGLIGLHTRFTARFPEIGLWLKTSAHRNGFGLEAVRALKAWVDASIEYQHITYPVAAENRSSRRIPESFGAVVEERYLSERTWAEPLNIVVYYIYPDS